MCYRQRIERDADPLPYCSIAIDPKWSSVYVSKVPSVMETIENALGCDQCDSWIYNSMLEMPEMRTKLLQFSSLDKPRLFMVLYRTLSLSVFSLSTWNISTQLASKCFRFIRSISTNKHIYFYGLKLYNGLAQIHDTFKFINSSNKLISHWNWATIIKNLINGKTLSKICQYKFF